MIATWTVEIPQWGSATLIEVLWFASGIMAMAYCVAHVNALVDDYLLTLGLREDRPQLRVAARGNLRREGVRFVIGGMIAGLGLYSMLQPAVVPGPARISFVGLLITTVFLGISFSTALMSWWDWHDRGTIQGLIALGYNGPKEETDG